MQPLIDYLIQQFPDSTKSTVKSWIKHQRVFVDGRAITLPHYLLQPTMHVEILSKRKFLGDKTLEILYEDRDLIIVDKSSGLLTVATPKKEKPTVHDLLKNYLHPIRPFPVHRLDRDTSGVLVFAKTMKSRDTLKESFFQRTIQRKYRAIVEGKLLQSGTWQDYIYEDATLVMRIADIPEKGKLAITHFHCMQTYTHSTLLEIRLETGRKNQIRLQASAAGYPIVGDKKYGARTNPLGRLGLHAISLGLAHPITQKPLSFSSRIPFPEFS